MQAAIYVMILYVLFVAAFAGGFWFLNRVLEEKDDGRD